MKSNLFGIYSGRDSNKYAYIRTPLEHATATSTKRTRATAKGTERESLFCMFS